jgi:hypothetical protein
MSWAWHSRLAYSNTRDSPTYVLLFAEAEAPFS